MTNPETIDVNDASFVPPHGTGVYAKNPGDPYCCWLARRALLRIKMPLSASKLDMTIAVPDVPAIRRHSLSLAVSVGGKAVITFSNLKFGASTLAVPLPPALSRAVVTMELKPNFSFVPKSEHMNGDRRQLSLILTGLMAE